MTSAERDALLALATTPDTVTVPRKFLLELIEAAGLNGSQTCAARPAAESPVGVPGPVPAAEYARRVGKSVKTVNRWAATGRVVAERDPGGRGWLIHPSPLSPPPRQATSTTTPATNLPPAKTAVKRPPLLNLDDWPPPGAA